MTPAKESGRRIEGEGESRLRVSQDAKGRAGTCSALLSVARMIEEELKDS